MGFDYESKGHHIYWPEKRSVTVERMVQFNVKNIPLNVNDGTPFGLEGENTLVEVQAPKESQIIEIFNNEDASDEGGPLNPPDPQDNQLPPLQQPPALPAKYKQC
ncbi:hypothetical protein SERLADRAFT_437417 [Serpula lacrymans var. lacrymans S7.9]|uniref:Uncharacterized protein n=1 Tax=Serpula lacrymans var. lacrymans (strain S7.9) TaxID=578457 RepID=F8NTM4_SERL9|nr:uncharacterized protein SERLADRAFT_437417 [Serpula lacrymans var. lacrymans S7.9]EGO25696.1 hypothetical protein SERLADRAFT_437417 [Serpula lacrymans var. lacrymans S7.9]